MLNGFKLIKIYCAGFCLSRGIFVQRSLGWKRVRFYARAFLLEHPQHGLILIDTGYGKALLEATRKGIYSLYSKLLPVTYNQDDSLVVQLSKDGISKKSLSYLILTHFHPDHVGALQEFADVPWIYRSQVLEYLAKLSKWRGLLNGFIHSLVPPVPKGSMPILNEDFAGSWHGFSSVDIFKDGSLHLIDLPGHALGQMGVALKDHVFVADANWGTQTLPHPLAMYLQENPRAYRKVFQSVQKIPSTIQVIPTHSIEVAHV